MQKITPCLWFDGQAKEAAKFYVSLFDDGRIIDVLRWGEGGHAPAGSVLTVTFELAGQRFIALNGGPNFKFTPAISMMILCKDQAELDVKWEQLLSGGGAPMECGWLTDRFGMSWQVTPFDLEAMLKDPDAAKAGRAMAAMMTMVKLDFAELRRAFDGE